MKNLAFEKPLSLAISEGGTTPDPGQEGVIVWSTTLGKPVWWDGSKWTAGTSGADPWTYLKLSSDFTTSSGTAVNVPGMSFVPAANTNYIIEGQLLMRTSAAATGPRPGIAWPTGLTNAVAEIAASSSATAQIMTFGNSSASVTSTNGALANTTASWPSRLLATMIVAAGPSGNFSLLLATEIGGNNVTLKAGSWMRYRSY